MKLFKYTNAYIFIISIALLSSCKPSNDDDLPIDPLLLTQDTLSLEAEVHLDDTLRGDAKDFGTIGAYYDPIFGKVNTSFYTTFSVTSSSPITPGSFNGLVVDSVVFSMQFVGSYGNANKLKGFLELDIHELTQKIDIPAENSAGYSTSKNFAFNPVPVGSLSTSPIIQPTAANYIISAKLDNSIGVNLMSLDSLTPTKVQDKLKGLYVRVKPSFYQNIAPGYGSVLYIGMTNTSATVTKLSVHIRYLSNGSFKNAEILFSPSVVGKTVRVNHFAHDYANTASPTFNTKLNNPTDTSITSLYIQAGHGVRVLVKVPDITSLPTADSTVIVNKAELILPIQENTEADLFLPPQQLYAYIYNTEASGSLNTANWVEDYANSWFSGKYDSDKKEYRLIITKYLNKVATGRLPNNGFFVDVAPLAKAASVNRVVLNSPNHPTKPMKLIVTYTKIKK